MGLAKGSGNGALRTLQTAEVKHGRAAMMAITGFAVQVSPPPLLSSSVSSALLSAPLTSPHLTSRVQEFVYGTPVVQQTPFFFLPFGGFGRG